MKLLELIIDFVVSVFDFLVSSPVANTATWVGTISSLFVLWSVRTIRSDFLFQARLPQLLELIQDNASAISKCLNDFDNNTDTIELELSTCKANLESIEQKLRGSAKKRIKKTAKSLISEIESYRTLPTKESARHFYTSLNGLIQDLRNLSEDQKWSTRDAG